MVEKTTVLATEKNYNTIQKNYILTDTNTQKNSHQEGRVGVSKGKMKQDLLVHNWGCSNIQW